MLRTRHGNSFARSSAIAVNRVRLFIILIFTLIALLAVLLLVPSRASAIDFNFSFVNLISPVGEVISGQVLGLVDDTTGPAADVTITDAGTLSFIVPLSTFPGASTNEWTVTSGVITSMNYLSIGFRAGPVDVLNINAFLVSLFDDGVFPGQLRLGTFMSSVVQEPGPEPPAVPEPASFLLLAIGLMGLRVLRRRKASRT